DGVVRLVCVVASEIAPARVEFVEFQHQRRQTAVLETPGQIPYHDRAIGPARRERRTIGRKRDRSHFTTVAVEVAEFAAGPHVPHPRPPGGTPPQQPAPRGTTHPPRPPR